MNDFDPSTDTLFLALKRQFERASDPSVKNWLQEQMNAHIICAELFDSEPIWEDGDPI
jgi:hypothetical protein